MEPTSTAIAARRRRMTMAGKYHERAKTLPKVENDDPKHAERVQMLKAMIVKLETHTPMENAQWKINALEENLEEQVLKIVQEITGTLGGGLTAAKVARAYGLSRKLKDAVNTAEAHANLLVAALEKFLSEAFESEGTTSIAVEGLGTVSCNAQPKGKVVDPIAFRNWCEANGYRDALGSPWPTMNSLVKQRFEKREAMPPGIEVKGEDLIQFREN
jgi:hypothetical protein